jgi:hypothetical protein
MLELRGKVGQSVLADEVASLASDRVRHFLVGSERRVATHCRQLLAEPTLPAGERSRLEDLLAEAEAALQRLLSPPDTFGLR